MSTSFIEIALATVVGVGAFYLLETLYYEISVRIKDRQIHNYLDHLEEEHWDD